MYVIDQLPYTRRGQEAQSAAQHHWFACCSTVRPPGGMQEPVATRGQPGDPQTATQKTKYTAMELQNLARQGTQHLGEPVPAWLF